MESISGPDGLLRRSVTHRCFPISWMGRFPTINSSIILIIPVLLTKTWLLRLLQDKFLSHFARGIQIVVTHVCRSISRLVSLFIYPPLAIPQVAAASSFVYFTLVNSTFRILRFLLDKQRTKRAKKGKMCFDSRKTTGRNTVVIFHSIVPFVWTRGHEPFPPGHLRKRFLVFGRSRGRPRAKVSSDRKWRGETKGPALSLPSGADLMATDRPYRCLRLGS